MDKFSKIISRRTFLLSAIGIGFTAFLTACGLPMGSTKSSPSPVEIDSTADGANDVLSPTPACGNDPVTPSLTEGPYFTPDSPERVSLLESGMKGTILTITGYVLSLDCKPVKHALLDFWQANADGEYDNAGYTLRGHQYTDDKGKFTLKTVVPGIYPGRTKHIHVKVQAPNATVLTTQLFFPGVSENNGDNLYLKQLEINQRENSDGSINGSFNFVVTT